MQIGTRWQSGSDAPASLSENFRIAIDQVDEVELGEAIAGDFEPGWWTLSYLESRPIAVLDGRIRVAQSADGTVSVSQADAPEPDEPELDW